MIRNAAVVLVLICNYCLAQVHPDTIPKRLLRYTQNFPQEKIYMHLDRPHYSPGDTVWFKLYIADASTHVIDSVSKNIYVDLYHKDDGRRVRQLMIKNLGGYSYGNIALRDTLPEGVYEIRAFTNWMRNFPESQFFHKEVYLRKRYASRNADVSINQGVLEVADLQFFPEGGNLVEGLQSRMAFKAVNKYGKGVDFAAYIISDRNDTVATIRSSHLGMGSFIFAPKAGQKYHAAIASASEDKLRQLYNLPHPLVNGYTLFVDNLTYKDAIKVIAKNNFSTKDRPIVMGHCRGIPVISFQSTTEGNSFSWTISKTDISDDGVVQLTLFDRTGRPQCQRLFYNNKREPLTVTMTSDKQEYSPREKVTISVVAKDYQGKPVQGNFSLAVTDDQQVNVGKDPENIHTYLYLSSDVQSLTDAGVKGPIEQPAYYFNPQNTNASVQLDVLLMTQGWRRFLWTDVLSDYPRRETFEVETGVTIRGKAKMVLGKKFTKPLNISMVYSPEPGAKAFDDAQTDLDGNFTFKNILIKESMVAMIQGAKNNGNRAVKISIDEYKWPECEATEGLVDPFFFDAEHVKTYLAQQKHYAELEEQLKNSKAKVLKEVTVTAKKEIVSDSRKTLYEGTNMQTVQVAKESCVTATHVLQLLQGRVSGLMITPSGEGYTAVVRGPSSITGSNGPKYLFDGMLIDESMLIGIAPCMVESIDVITHPVPMYNAKGLISILSKGANPNYDWSKEEPQGTLYAKLKGYESPREFYSPKYELNQVPRNEPDFRATLYWNPLIKTDAQGRAKITFWNSNEETSVRINVEGVSRDGRPVSAVGNYVVVK